MGWVQLGMQDSYRSGDFRNGFLGSNKGRGKRIHGSICPESVGIHKNTNDVLALFGWFPHFLGHFN